MDLNRVILLIGILPACHISQVCHIDWSSVFQRENVRCYLLFDRKSALSLLLEIRGLSWLAGVTALPAITTLDHLYRQHIPDVSLLASLGYHGEALHATR